jgi:hypothetical protein
MMMIWVVAAQSVQEIVLFCDNSPCFLGQYHGTPIHSNAIHSYIRTVKEYHMNIKNNICYMMNTFCVTVLKPEILGEQACFPRDQMASAIYR